MSKSIRSIKNIFSSNPVSEKRIMRNFILWFVLTILFLFWWYINQFVDGAYRIRSYWYWTGFITFFICLVLLLISVGNYKIFGWIKYILFSTVIFYSYNIFTHSGLFREVNVRWVTSMTMADFSFISTEILKYYYENDRLPYSLSEVGPNSKKVSALITEESLVYFINDNHTMAIIVYPRLNKKLRCKIDWEKFDIILFSDKDFVKKLKAGISGELYNFYWYDGETLHYNFNIMNFISKY